VGLSVLVKKECPETVVPKISPETVAELVGTTRSRVGFFRNSLVAFSGDPRYGTATERLPKNKNRSENNPSVTGKKIGPVP
jgi:hypothetical protein